MLSTKFPSLFLLGVVLLTSTSQAAGNKCYRLNGDDGSDAAAPCNPNADVSACCDMNKDRPDICLESGLCLSQDIGYESMLYANGCTDKTGKATACPNLCPQQSKSSNDQPQSYNVLQCNQGSHYCCREVDDTKNCCDGPNTFSANIGKLLLPTKTISVSGTGTAAVTTTPTSDSSSQKDTSDSKCPKNNTAVVGGAVGGVLGVALLAALGTIAALTLRKPKNTEPTNVVAEAEYSSVNTAYKPPTYEPSPYRPVELSEGAMPEMPAQPY